MSDSTPAAKPFAPLSRAALALVAAFFAVVAWDQSVWWRSMEDYSFGYLAPVFCLYVIHERRGLIQVALGRCSSEGSPHAAGWRHALLTASWLVATLFGGLMFLLGAANAATSGPAPASTLATTLGAILAGTGLVWISAPDAPERRPSSILGDARWKLIALFVFPMLVWLISAPLVGVVEGQLRRFLLHQVVTVVFFVFDTFGLSIQQQGSVLIIPSGHVGVEEACSGIRSLTGCLFAGSFLSALFLDRLWKKIALLACALALAFATNLLRSLFLTAWAYRYGAGSIQGMTHDIAGYAVLGITTLGLLCLLPLFNLKAPVAKTEDRI
ncbi:MAG: exosortase/archaeosortase family protein [Opitutaceae bacterium]|jgi:exosortase/archaeosortase family protein